MKKRPTINDVAAHAGVSKSTVSLVLQGSKLVRDETAAQVREAMAATGYVYNRAAANLRSTSVGLIGLVINDLRNPFFTEFATSLQMSLSAHGYATVISNSDEDPALQAQLVGSMIEHGVSAFVISPAYGDAGATFDQMARAGVPTLQVLRQIDPRSELFPFSSFDYTSGGAEATAHLIAQGARHIAFVGGQEGRAITQERMSGYLSEMAAAGLEPLALHGRNSRGFGAEAVDRLLADHPQVDAAICFNDLVALGMMTGLARAGRQAGRDMALVGFDDIEECVDAWPQLSSVSCDIAAFGRATAKGLIDWLADGKRPVETRRAPVHLVTRASSMRGSP